MLEIVQHTLFDLIQETHLLLREKETLEDQYIDVVVKIGQKLIAMRPYKPYGEFIPFLEEEFSITQPIANDSYGRFPHMVYWNIKDLKKLATLADVLAA